MRTTARTALALLLALAAIAPAAKVEAGAFHAWQVANVAWGDILNVRAYPSGTSQKQAAYPNGTIMQMTGRCTDGLNLDQVAHLAPAQQAQAVRYRWCEVWHDPRRDNVFVTGWVYGRYIAPY